MSEIALAKINSFASPAMQADFVPPSEEAVFVLTSGQLKDIIKEAIQPMQDRISSLEDRTASLEEENATMRLKLTSLEATEEREIDRLSLDIAYDRQRLAKLERVEPQPMQKDRGEILRALLAANGGKMLAKDARQKMHLSRSRFSELLASMSDYVDTKPYHLNKSAKILILK